MVKSREIHRTNFLLATSSLDKMDTQKVQAVQEQQKTCCECLRRIMNEYPNLFYHWVLAYKLR